MTSRISLDAEVAGGKAPAAGPRGGFVYRLARRLDSYSFAAVPEQLAVLEGLRAAVAISSLIVLAVWLDRPMLSWAAFGAFWTCLADPGGPDRHRLACMGGFAMAGTVAAFAASTAGHAGVMPSAGMLLALAFLTGLSGTYGPAAAQVGTLTAVVAVVAIAFPQTPLGAFALSSTFLLGTLCALLLCIGIWRIHPAAAARRALGAVYLRLGDMLATLLALDGLGARTFDWICAEAEHRRAVRSAIERARSIILKLVSGSTRYRGELDTADQIFAVLVAAEHDLGTRGTALSAAERGVLYQLLLLQGETRRQTARLTPRPDLLAAGAAALRRAAQGIETVTGRAISVAAAALADQAQAWTMRAAVAAAPGDTSRTGLVRPVPAVILRHAARLAVAVLVAYAMAAALGLKYSYWATMATVLVVQPAAGATWPRSLERMLGSIVGGLLAALVVALAPAPLAILSAIFPIAAATIALRRVNYTLHVASVTTLFVLVTELLLPASGIPAARVVNNVIGSVVGAVAAMLLWPDRSGNGLEVQLADAVAANLALAAQAFKVQDAGAGFDAARRAAGVASTTAETTCHRLALVGQGRRLHLREATHVLAALRRLAGAATAQSLADQAADPARASTIAEASAPLVAALRNPARSPPLSFPAAQPDDGIRTAIESVTEAIATYVAEFRPDTRRPG